MGVGERHSFAQGSASATTSQQHSITPRWIDDPRILTLADTTHSESEERWFSIGLANNGVPMTGGSRRSTASEIRSYTENQ
jgi:hypothetical protein